MKIFDIIYNATNESHIAFMDCSLKVLKTFIREFTQSEEGSEYYTNWTKEDKAKYHTKCAKAAMEVLDKIAKSDTVVFRTVNSLYKEEIAAIVVEVAYHKDEES